MQITGLWEAVSRRWLPLLLIVALGIGLGVFGWTSTDEKYNARAVVVLVPPAVPGQPNEGNPLSRVSNDSSELSTLAVTVMNSPEVGLAILNETGGALVSVDNLLSTTTPNPQRTVRITLTAEGNSRDQAVNTAATAIRATSEEFAKFQGGMGTPATYQARLVQIVPPFVTNSDRSSKLRAAGGLALGSIALGVIAVLAVDIVLTRRSRRRLAVGEARRRQAEPVP